MDRVVGLQAEIDPDEYDPLNVRENIKRIIDNENIRNRGFNTAVNNLTSILDTSKMGYQHIENFKNAREAIVREYEDTNIMALPDERYAIRLTYVDDEQIRAMRNAYDLQFEELRKEIMKVVDVSEVLYNDFKKAKNVQDYQDIANHYLRKDQPKQKGWFSARAEEETPAVEEHPKLWNEVTFIPPRATEVEELNKTNIHIVEELRKRTVNTRKQLQTIFGNQHPTERTIVEQRLHFLERKFEEFEANVNPYHILPGLVLEIDITSVKRKRTTMMAMANMLNEFLYSVSKGFHDTAFAQFSRRRSTVRTDLAQTFEQVTD